MKRRITLEIDGVKVDLDEYVWTDGDKLHISYETSVNDDEDDNTERIKVNGKLLWFTARFSQVRDGNLLNDRTNVYREDMERETDSMRRKINNPLRDRARAIADDATLRADLRVDEAQKNVEHAENKVEEAKRALAEAKQALEARKAERSAL